MNLTISRSLKLKLVMIVTINFERSFFPIFFGRIPFCARFMPFRISSGTIFSHSYYSRIASMCADIIIQYQYQSESGKEIVFVMFTFCFNYVFEVEERERERERVKKTSQKMQELKAID